MAINAVEVVKRLRSGEQVTCFICGKGYLKGMTKAPVDAETHFSCSKCGEKLILNIKSSSNERFSHTQN